MRTLIPAWTNRSFTTDLWREMDRLLGDFDGRTQPANEQRLFVPRAEVEETENHFLLSFDLPGMKNAHGACGPTS